MSTFTAYLTMSRISNLPTVWSNCIVGAAVFFPFSWQYATIISGVCSLFYISGMILNDVCDEKIDRIERPQRPIPMGKVSISQARLVAICLLCIAIFLCEYTYALRSFWHLTAPIMLATSIVLYDVWHKGNYFSPFIMALCRFFVYLLAALSISDKFPIYIVWIALVSASYIVGLTYLAMQENLKSVTNMWPILFLIAPFVYALVNHANILLCLLAILWSMRNLYQLHSRNIKAAITGFISGICFVDAMLLSTFTSQINLIWGCLLFFVCTVFFQRFIPGT